MTCEDLRTRLIDYYEGELDNKDQDFVEGHLKGCKGCLAELDQIIYTLELVLRSFAVPELSDVFWSQFTLKVMNKIQREKEKIAIPLIPLRLFNFPRKHFGFATATLAAVLLFVLGLLGYYGYIDYSKDQNLPKLVQKEEAPIQKTDPETLIGMLQEDPQIDARVLSSILGEVTVDKVEDIIEYELVLLEMNSIFDMSDVDGMEVYIESLLKSLNEKEKEILLSKLHNMI